MSAPGSLRIVGLGPGGPAWITREASHLIANATDLVGYAPYLERLPQKQGQTRHQTGNRVEIERARHALRLVEDGRHVALVSGGDPGVFAMAAAVFEAIEDGEPRWRDIDIAVSPGISAMQAAAARTGAPLGHDFCAISLSDNRKPWSVVEKRLAAAANADFVIALYNPASAARPGRIHDAFALLRSLKSASTPVVFARAVGREDEYISIETLASADSARTDMSTLIIVGSSETRIVPRGSGTPFVYTPRGVKVVEQ
jgi:precorrin-3B C17-methyltransferase / cobalt-factor III methyltransferase